MEYKDTWLTGGKMSNAFAVWCCGWANIFEGLCVVFTLGLKHIDYGLRVSMFFSRKGYFRK